MKVIRLNGVMIATLILFTFVAIPNLAAPQGITSLAATANGKGTLTVGKEVFEVTTVLVKLKEDSTGDLTLVTDLQLFITCTWSSPTDLSKGIDLKITGGLSAGSGQGSGKLFLKPDGKSIASLAFEAMSNTAKRKIKLDFTAE
jgi:hypothetical protein